MKHVSPLRLSLLALCLALAACANGANRRALYYPTEPRGPWHDYGRRQVVAAQLGVPAAALPTPVPGSTPAIPGTGPSGAPNTVAKPVGGLPTQATLPPPSSTTEVLPPAVPPSTIAQ